MNFFRIAATFLLFFSAPDAHAKTDAHAKMRLGVNLAAYNSGEIEAANYDVDLDITGTSVGHTPGISLGYRFADQIEAGATLATSSTELEDAVQTETATGVYATYYLTKASLNNLPEFTWLVGASAASSNTENGELEIDGTAFGAYGGAEMELTRTASLSAKIGYSRITMEIEDIEFEGSLVGMNLALHVWLP